MKQVKVKKPLRRYERSFEPERTEEEVQDTSATPGVFTDITAPHHPHIVLPQPGEQEDGGASPDTSNPAMRSRKRF